MFGTYQLAQKMPGGDKMVAFTRILHRQTDDALSPRVPTFRANPLHPGGCAGGWVGGRCQERAGECCAGWRQCGAQHGLSAASQAGRQAGRHPVSLAGPFLCCLPACHRQLPASPHLLCPAPRHAAPVHCSALPCRVRQLV